MTGQIEAAKIHDIAQIAFTVPDLDQAKAFYRDILRLPFLFDAGTMAFFQCGSIRLMLGQPDQPVSSDGTIVYFRVPDLDAAASSLKAQEVPFVQEPHLVARMKSHDLWLAFIKDPAGNTLGLMSEVVRNPERA